MKERLESERGASFALALLLLVVCVAVSSVLIGATTTVAGSAAQLKQGEQRYYTVASAARLVSDCLGGDEVEVQQTRTASEPAEYGAPAAMTGHPVLKLATMLWLYGDNPEVTNADKWKVLDAGLYPETLLATPQGVDLDFTVGQASSVEDDALQQLKVKARGSLNADGRLDLTLRNVYAGGEDVESEANRQINKQFFMKVVLEPSIKVMPSARDIAGAAETRRAVVEWHVVDASEARVSAS